MNIVIGLLLVAVGLWLAHKARKAIDEIDRKGRLLRASRSFHVKHREDLQ